MLSFSAPTNNNHTDSYLEIYGATDHLLSTTHQIALLEQPLISWLCES